MRIFVAGATGTLGRPVVHALASDGYEVTGLTRTDNGTRLLHALGAQAIIGNALDARRVTQAVLESRAEVVVHLLTSLPPGGVLRKSQLRPTNELRTTGTANLIAASLAAGARRIVAESFVGIYGTGGSVAPASEEKPLPSPLDGAFKDTILALRALEDQLRAASAKSGLETVALRIGLLYGSGVPSTHFMIAQARAGRMFVPAGLSGVLPFVHHDDAVAAIVAAIESPNPSSVYNIVDDEALGMRDFVSQLLAGVSAPAPRSIPLWVVRIAAPIFAVLGSSRIRLDNTKAKRELAWVLRYPTVRAGLVELQKNLPIAA